MRRALLAAGLLLAVAGCGGTPAGAAAQPDPAALVGGWSAGGLRVLLDTDGVEVVDGCATALGSWRADAAGRFVSSTDAVLPCPDGSGAAPAWLGTAGGFRFDGADAVLLDRAGGELVRLVPAEPAPGTGTVDPARPGTGRAVASGPAPAAPDGAGPAGPDALTGSWTAGAGAEVEFAADGTWSGTDGCNGTGGAWTAGPDGGFLATAAAVRTLIACDGPGGQPDVGASLATARAAAVDPSGELLLLDAGGAVLLRLARS